MLMVTVAKHSYEMLVEKQSKFIAHLVPYNMYEKVLGELRTEHPKARHFVRAFRYINEFEQIVEGSSDDGEPRGTSGKPVLAVLQGNALINIAVIVVRYFGGTKLGTGGLARAYSDAANMVIVAAEPFAYRKEENRQLRCSYSDLGKVEYAASKNGVTVEEKRFEPFSICLVLRAPSKQLEKLQSEIERLVFE